MFEELLQVFDHLVHVLSHLVEVRIEDALPFIPGFEIIELRKVTVLAFFLVYLLHIEVCLAETYKGFSGGNNKKEKAK